MSQLISVFSLDLSAIEWEMVSNLTQLKDRDTNTPFKRHSLLQTWLDMTLVTANYDTTTTGYIIYSKITEE